jgi:hypothetical protein
MANALNSNTDPICPTYASGTFALITGTGSVNEFNNDFYNGKAGATYGYNNEFTYGRTVGANNNDWANASLSQSVPVVYRNGLLSFGNTGRQS